LYPYLRLIKTVVAARFRPPLAVGEASVLKMRVWPGDSDMFAEMNNGRHLTLMDLGRFDFSARTGLVRAAMQRKWGFVVGGASIRYRRRLKPFRAYAMRTEILGHDSRWFYFHQTTERNGLICSAALVRAGVSKRGGGLVEADEVLEAIGFADWGPPLPAWVSAWIAAEGLRPWPGASDSAS
jgi:acyl-CoA thioesterase FadM